LSHFKKVLITISDDLLQEIDCIAEKEQKNRSLVIREVMTEYVRGRKSKSLAERLAAGYREMAEINLNMAQECFNADEDTLRHYEEKLTECE